MKNLDKTVVPGGCPPPAASCAAGVEGGSTTSNSGSYLDQQGSRVKLGVAYLFVYGMPGPDVTAMVVDTLNEDGTVSGWDVNFKFEVENMKTDRLWRPLKWTWADKGERQAIIEYAGESALDLTP